jgi:hypothetical protein
MDDAHDGVNISLASDATGQPSDREADTPCGTIRVSCTLHAELGKDDGMAPQATATPMAATKAVQLTSSRDEDAMKSAPWRRFSPRNNEELHEAWRTLHTDVPVALLPARGDQAGRESIRQDLIRIEMPGRDWARIDFSRMQWRSSECRRRVRRFTIGRLEGVRELVDKASTLLVNRSKTAEYITEAVDLAASAAQTLADDAMQWWYHPAEDRPRLTAQQSEEARVVERRSMARNTRTRVVTNNRVSVDTRRSRMAFALDEDRKAAVAAELARRADSELPPLAFNYARQ